MILLMMLRVNPEHLSGDSFRTAARPGFPIYLEMFHRASLTFASDQMLNGGTFHGSFLD